MAELPPKGTLYVDDEGKSYRVTAHWDHPNDDRPISVYMQTQSPSGGEGMTFLSLIPESARIVWSPNG